MTSRVVMMMQLSLDGFMEGRNHEIDWHMVDEELHWHFNRELKPMGAFIGGRKTYELMAEFWPTADQDPENPPPMVEFAAIWRDTPKVVFSKTLQSVADSNTTVLHDITPEIVADLKSRYDGDLALGGAETAAAFMRLGLIDEYRLYIHPIAIGGGRPLFPPGETIRLSLVETRRFGNGVVQLTYQPS